MSKELINFERIFEIWTYQVSPHQQLLLRSLRRDRYATRIEVLFKQVGAINIPTRVQSLAVSEATEHEALLLGFQAESLRREHQKLFLLRGTGYSGYVVAGSVNWHEGDLKDDEKSYFSFSMEMPGFPLHTRIILLSKIRVIMLYRRAKNFCIGKKGKKKGTA